MKDAPRKIADELREGNNPPGTTPPDIGWQQAPPGRTPETMTEEQQELVLIAVEGLASHLRGQHARAVPGTEPYLRLSRMIGSLTVTANQIRRWLDARKGNEIAQEANDPPRVTGDG